MSGAATRRGTYTVPSPSESIVKQYSRHRALPIPRTKTARKRAAITPPSPPTALGEVSTQHRLQRLLEPTPSVSVEQGPRGPAEKGADVITSPRPGPRLTPPLTPQSVRQKPTPRSPKVDTKMVPAVASAPEDGISPSARPRELAVAPFDARRYSGLPRNKAPKCSVPAGVADMNRYEDILPNRQTRVVLKKTGLRDASGYINANWIKGATGRPRDYVAAQGPLPNTVSAFWRMLWESGTKAVVMVTGLVERGCSKCARYWPEKLYNAQTDRNEVTFGAIRVRLLSSERASGYVINELEARRGSVSKIIRHFWFTEWPDHGVPDTTAHLAGLREAVRHWCDPAEAPWVVHCSAGVGRTGTFIAIDYGISQLQATGHCDLISVIGELRSCRGVMVQHECQAQFAHEALLSHVQKSASPQPQAHGAVVPASSTPEAKGPPSSHVDDIATVALSAEREVKVAEEVLGMLHKRASVGRPKVADLIKVVEINNAVTQAKAKFDVARLQYAREAGAAGRPGRWPPAAATRVSSTRAALSDREGSSLDVQADDAEMKARRAEQRVDSAVSALAEFDKTPSRSLHAMYGSSGNVDRRRDELANGVHLARKRFYKCKKDWEAAAKLASCQTTWPPVHRADKRKAELAELDGALNTTANRVREAETALENFVDQLAATQAPRNATVSELDALMETSQKHVVEAEADLAAFEANPPDGDPDDVDNMHMELKVAGTIARKKFKKVVKKYEAAATEAGLPTEWSQRRTAEGGNRTGGLAFDTQADADCKREELAQEVVIAKKKFNKMLRTWVTWRKAAGLSTAWPSSDDVEDASTLELTPADRVAKLEATLIECNDEVKRAVAAVVQFKIQSANMAYDDIESQGSDLHKSLATARRARDAVKSQLDDALRQARAAGTAETSSEVSVASGRDFNDPHILETVLEESIKRAEEEAAFVNAEVHPSQRDSLFDDDDEPSDVHVPQYVRDRLAEKYDEQAYELQNAVDASKGGSAACRKHQRKLDRLTSQWESQDGQQIIDSLDSLFEAAVQRFSGQKTAHDALESTTGEGSGSTPAFTSSTLSAIQSSPSPMLLHVSPELTLPTAPSKNWGAFSDVVSEMVATGGRKHLRSPVIPSKAPKRDSPEIALSWQKTKLRSAAQVPAQPRCDTGDQVSKPALHLRHTGARVSPIASQCQRKNSAVEVALMRARIMGARTKMQHVNSGNQTPRSAYDHLLVTPQRRVSRV